MSEPLDDDLRRVLRERMPAHADDDVFLARVHAGASRRRTRRRIAVAASVAGVATIALAVPLSLVDVDPGPAQEPAASPSEESVQPAPSEPAPEPGTPVEPTDVQVTAVSAVSDAEFWVLGTGTCASRDCAVVGRGGVGAEPEFVTAPGPADRATTLRMAAGGNDGWVVTGDTLYATHDGARTWDDVTVPGMSVPLAVTVSDDQVWVRGEDAGGRTARLATATAPVSSDDFVDAGLPAAFGDPGFLSEPAATRTDADTVYGFLRDRATSTFDATIGGAAWTSRPVPSRCWGTDSLSGANGALWAVCGTEAGPRPMVSVDKGVSWDVLGVDISPDPVIAAIDGDRAAISNDIGLFVLNGDRLDNATPPGEGAGTRRDTYLGFTTEDVGYLIDDQGRLSRTDNSGASWELLELP